MSRVKVVAVLLVLAAGLPILSAAADDARADFRLQDFLGRSWSQESVRFALSPRQARLALDGEPLISNDGSSVLYQVDSSAGGAPSMEVLTDLGAFETREFKFADRGSGATPTQPSDLIVDETDSLVRIFNRRTGVAIRKSLAADEGPIAAIRLASGRWIGDSRLESPHRAVSYSASVVARGPVFAEIQCKIAFEGGGSWELHVRLQSFEPAVILDESFSAGDASEFRLVLNHGFAPTHVLHRRGRGTASNANAVGEVMVSDLPPNDGDLPFRLEPWLHWWEHDRQGNWFGLYNDGDDDDLVAVGALEAGVWVDPQVPAASRSSPLLPLDLRGPDLTLTFPLRGGKRKWLVSTFSRSETLAPLTAGKTRFAPLPQAYVIKHGDFPLSLIKDYTLKWEGEEVSHPRLFVTPKDLERLRSSATAISEAAARFRDRGVISPYTLDASIASYLATGSRELGSRLASTAVAWVQDAVNMFIQQDAFPTMGFAPHQQWKLLSAMNVADAVLSSDLISQEMKERLAAQIAFLAYTVARADYWSPERGFAANPNMTTAVGTYQTILACMIPTHPLAGTWVESAMRELKTNELDTWADDRGGWLEAPHYAMVSYDHLVGSFLAAKNAGFNDYLFDPKMKLVAEWFAKISTPIDAAAGNRHLPPIGNTYVREPTGEFSVLAYLWRSRDPDFSSTMQWMHHQQGSPLAAGVGGLFAALTGYRMILSDKSIPERIPAYASEWFNATGVVLRNGFASGRETQLYLIAGANHAHYDRDSGSFTLWGKGRIVSNDFGYSGQAPGEDHSMATSARAPDSAIMQITRFSAGKNVDYVSGMKNDAWERQIVFMKDADPMGPNYFVIHDKTGNDPLAKSRIWFTADEIRVDGRKAMVVGKEDVDTDLFFAPQAGEAISSSEKSVASWGLTGKAYGRVVTAQKSVVLPIDPKLGLTTVLFPRLKSDTQPIFRQFAEGRGVRIESAAGTDYVFLASEPFEYSEGSISFQGTVGAITIRNGNAELWLGRSGSIAALGEALHSP